MSEEDETKPQTMEQGAGTATNESTAPSSADSGAPLTRKRTRDDFEADNKEEAELEERKIAPLKRRKSVTEECKDEASVEKVKKIASITEGSKEGTAEAEEPKTETETETETTADNTTQRSQETKTDEADSNEDKSTEEKTAEKMEDSKDKPATTAPRFVFGATTPFGANAFSMANKTNNVFASGASSTAASTKSVFGSGSSFGNAFQSAITKKSIFDEDKATSESPAPEAEKSELESSKNTHMYKQVDLEKKDVKSGEEDEEQVFTCRAKLYALDLTNVKNGWKERGVGNIHLNKSKEVGKSSRIIMRSNGLLKVILNTALVQGLEVVKGMPSSMNPEKFIRITSVEDSKPIQYAIKTGNVETTETMFNTIAELIPKEV